MGVGGAKSASAGATSAGGTASMRTVGASSNGAAGNGSGAVSCPTYSDDFLPQINTPVCSNCHNGSQRVGNWAVYAQAKASCSQIGSRVATGAMPPRNSGYSLSTAQRSLVAAWVRLGCPQMMSDLPNTCAGN